MHRNVRWVRGLVCSSIVLMLAGCATWGPIQKSTIDLNYPHARTQTLTMSPHEHYQQVSRASAIDARALIEDLDLLFLTERPTRLMRWHSP